MKKIASLLLAVLLAAAFPLNGDASGGRKIVSSSAVLMDADTGEVLWSKNRDVRRYPASITKVLTGLLVVENAGAGEIATASAGALKLPKGYAHIALQSGDSISVDDAMYSMMLASANDAANVLAEHVGGTRAEFVAMMNSRAREIGAENSNFTNPSGVPGDRHYTTAYDMALITREAIQSPVFARYFGAKLYTLPAVNSATRPVELKSYQYMLLEDKDEYYPYVTGGKIGYTPQAGHTMCTVAERGGRRLVCVVLGSTRDGKYADTRALLEYGFSL